MILEMQCTVIVILKGINAKEMEKLRKKYFSA